jgi:hypothetical protein
MTVLRDLQQLTATPEQQQADDLFRRFQQHSRIFVAERGKGDVYTVKVLGVDQLRDVNFRHVYEFWGVERQVVADMADEYTRRIAGIPRCKVAVLIRDTILDAMERQIPARKVAARSLALAARQTTRPHMDDVAWLCWRLLRLYEWGDHLGMADLLATWTPERLDDVVAATLMDHGHWHDVMRREANKAAL